jgi:hypothetical protein
MHTIVHLAIKWVGEVVFHVLMLLFTFFGR